MAVDSGSASKKGVSVKDRIKSPLKKEAKSKRPYGSAESADISSPSKRNKSPGVRLVGSRIYDPVNGKTCHQCRQKTRDFVAACSNQRNNKSCPIMFCHKCLLNRYGEKAEEASNKEEWNCPKCRGICNCSICMKKRGHQPTGILINTAKATGFSSVSEMLLKGAGHFTNVVASPNKEAVVFPRKRGKENSFYGKVDANLQNPTVMNSKKVKVLKNDNVDNDASLKIIGKVPKKRKIKQEQAKEINDPKGNGSFPWEKKATKMKRDRSNGMNNGTNNKVNSKENDANDDVKKQKTARDGLTNKDEYELARRRSPRKLNTLDNICKKRETCNTRDDCKRNANRLISSENDEGKEEKCNTTNGRNVLKLPSEDFHIEIPLPMGSELRSIAGMDVCAENVGDALQFLEFCAVFGKILEVRKGQPEYILRDLIHGRTGRRGKYSATVQFLIQMVSVIQADRGEDETPSPSHGNNSWVHALKKCVAESRSVNKSQGLDLLENVVDYETLATSEKLRLLNFLCDEALGTEKMRTWIDKQNTKVSEKVKEARQLVTAAKDKEKSLKQKMQDDIAKVIILNNGAGLSISEHEAIVSRIKAEAAQAHAEVLESSGTVNNYKKCDAVRIEPMFKGRVGHAYWKLNCTEKSDVLHQHVGNGEPLTSEEQWFAIDSKGEEAILKHISSLRGRSVRVSRGLRIPL